MSKKSMQEKGENILRNYLPELKEKLLKYTRKDVALQMINDVKDKIN